MSVDGMNGKPDEPEGIVSGSIDVEQIEESLVSKVMAYARTHPWVTRAAIGAGALVSTAGPVAAVSAMDTQINDTFTTLNNVILPRVGDTITALPQVVIPIVMLIVIIVILLFVPELLYGLLDMLKGAFKLKK